MLQAAAISHSCRRQTAVSVRQSDLHSAATPFSQVWCGLGDAAADGDSSPARYRQPLLRTSTRAACVHAAVRHHVRGAFSRPNRQYSRPDWMGRLDLLSKCGSTEACPYCTHDRIKRHSTTGLKRLFHQVDYPCIAADKASKQMSLGVVTEYCGYILPYCLADMPSLHCQLYFLYVSGVALCTLLGVSRASSTA